MHANVGEHMTTNHFLHACRGEIVQNFCPEFANGSEKNELCAVANVGTVGAAHNIRLLITHDTNTSLAEHIAFT